MHALEKLTSFSANNNSRQCHSSDLERYLIPKNMSKTVFKIRTNQIDKKKIKISSSLDHQVCQTAPVIYTK